MFGDAAADGRGVGVAGGWRGWMEEAELRCLRGGAGDRRDWRCCSEVVAAMVVGDFRGAAVRRENLRFMCQW